jgi:hypothetical protein
VGSRNFPLDNPQTDMVQMLQWGRDHTVAELCSRKPSKLSMKWLQWGRDRAAAELPREFSPPYDMIVLQWGRDRGVAELACPYAIQFSKTLEILRERRRFPAPPPDLCHPFSTPNS